MSVSVSTVIIGSVISAAITGAGWLIYRLVDARVEKEVAEFKEEQAIETNRRQINDNQVKERVDREMDNIDDVAVKRRLYKDWFIGEREQ